ncbi:MAG: M23 family metallopeptidase [Brevinematia bacterium]
MKRYIMIINIILFSLLLQYKLLANEFSLLTHEVKPGGILIITTTYSDFSNINVLSSLTPQITYPFYLTQYGSISIIPIPIEVTNKEIELKILEKGQLVKEIKVKLEQINRVKRVKLTLPEKSRKILNQKEEIIEDIRFIFSKITSFPLYSLKDSFPPSFSLPSDNKITSFFGEARVYPDRRVRYHKGIDFSYLPDPNVYSVGDGIVVISSNFVANGESIYIYHGYGILSSYFHLEQKYVQEGEYVKKGQIIGKIGKTGIATGPHLHFGIYILGKKGYVPINPLSYISIFNKLTTIHESKNSSFN